MMKNLLTFASVAKKTTQLLSTVARLRLLFVMLLTLCVSAAWGAEEVVYTLTPAVGNNNSYAGNCDVTIDDIEWNLTGNSTTAYWRIGGKSITNVDRALYSKTPIQEDISKIVISHGAASSITVNSVTLIVSTDADGAGTTISTLSSPFNANSTMTFTRPAGTSWADAYYKFVYNVTVSGSSNKFVEFKEAEFYAEKAPAVQYSITFNAGSGTCDTESLTETSAGAGVTLPTATIDCGDVAWTFAGWAEASVATETAEAPSNLYEAGDTYKPTSNITLYAVYKRTEEGEGSGGGDVTESVDFSTKSYSDGQEVSSYEGTNFSVTFDKGTNSNAPKYYNSGTAIRVYAGGYFIVSSEATITKIVLTFGSSDKTNTITTNIDTYSNGTWTGSATSVKFTIGGTKDHRRIQAIEVTTSGGGSSSTTYYHSTPQCSTETLVSLHPNGGTIDGDSDTQEIQTENGTLTLPEPTRDCYTFTNWNTKENGTGESFAAGEIADWDSEIITLYAQWTQNTYTITWKNGDAVLETDNNVPCGTTPTYDSATPTKLSTAQYTYSFNGWNPEIYAADKDQVYTAQFASTTRQYTVTFDANGHGSAPANQIVDYGTKVTEPSAPTAFGYTFGGWYKEAECYNVWDFATDVVTRNITLYAQWTEKALTDYRTFCDVVCDAYSFHTGSDDNREEWLKEAIKCFVEAEGGYEHEWQIKDYIIPNDDKFFVGNYGYFYNDNLGIGANGKSRSAVSDWGNMYLAPAMDENDAQGTPRLGHAKGAKGTLRIFEDSNWDNLFVGFIPDGYKLKFGDEEYTFAKTTGTEYRSDVVQYNSTNADKNVSVGVVDADGKYVATNHTQEMRHIFLEVSKPLDGGSWADANAKFAIYYWNNSTNGWCGFLKKVPSETTLYEGWVPTDATGFKFVRYNNDQSAPGNWNSDNNSNIVWNETGNLTFPQDPYKGNLFTITDWGTGTWSTYEKYGQFAMHDNSKSKNWYVHFVPHYVLTYDKNADDAIGEMDIQTVAVDATDKDVPVASCGFTRVGYDFKNWRKDETSTYYNAGVNIELSADITLYAQWTAKEITITWDANGGSVDPTSSTYTYNGATITPPTPTRANYIFNGWFTDRSGGKQIPDVGNTNKPTEDVTYYAQWTEKATPTFAWSAATCTAALEADNTFPTLNNPNTLPVTYTSSNTDVATIDANGNITLVATGPTTITAIGAETDTHKSATTTYELTVVESNCRWVEVTDNTTLEDGDEVVITMGKSGKTYALPNAKRTTSDPAPEAIDVTSEIVGNEMTSVANNVRWTVERDGDYYVFYTITSEGRYNLYCNSSDNGVCVAGSGNALTNHKFNIEGDYLKSQSQLRYLSVSIGTNSWRSPTDNTTSTYSGQTLKFYKRECLDATSYWVTWDAGGGTWEDKSSKKLESYQEGETITEPAAPSREGYRFDGWTPAPTTMPAQNTTFTAKWTEVYKITWYENGVPSYTYVPSDNPVVTWEDNIADCGEKKFYGWTTDETFVSDPTTPPTCIEKGIRIAGDVTYYAVYADAVEPANPGYEKVTTISEGTYLIATDNTANKAYTGRYSTNAYGGCCDVTISNDVITEKPDAAVEVTVTLDDSNFYMHDGTYYLGYTSGNAMTFDASIQTGNQNIWKLTAEGYIESVNVTGRILQYNSGSPRFACYTGTQKYAYLYKKQTTTYANFAVSCATYAITITPPTGGTVTTNPADEAGAGQTITVNVTPADCKYLTALKYYDGSDHAISIANTPYTFVMPAADVTVTATFADKTATDIEILTSAHRMLMQGSAFVGEQVRITYNNGDKETLNWNDSRLTFTGYNTATLGSQTVTVTYNDCGTQSASYNIEVIDGLGITFWDGDYTETIKYEPGDLVDVDNKIGQSICDGWKFVGWSETKVANESNGFTPVHNFNATDAKVLYAVYVETSTDWISAYNIDELHPGAKYIIIAHYSSDNEYALTNTSTTNASYLDGAKLTTVCEQVREGDAYPYKDRYKLKVTPDENWKWQLENTGSGWTMRNIKANKYLKVNSDKTISLTATPDDKFTLDNGSNDSEITTLSSSNNYLSWYNSSKYWNGHTSGQQYYLTNETNFTSTPPCSPLSATFHGNGGIVMDGVNSGDDLTITEPTRDAGITTPTASFADCDGKSWTFVGWAREEIDVTRVPILTTDLLHDGGGNKPYKIQEDGEEFWAVFTNTGDPETKYGTITFTDDDVTRQYENAKTITKSVTAMGDYDFELYHVSNASSLGIQFDNNNATRGYIKNITSLGKINSISLNDFQTGDINDVKVYVGNTSDAINILLTEADLQQTGNTYTYYPPKNYAYVKIEANGYCGITSISIDFGKGTQIWATTPDCSTITLSGDELYVTSTNGQSIRAAERLTVKAVQLESKAKVVISSNSSDIYFSDVQDANFTQAVKPTKTLTLTADVDGNLSATEIYVHYRPSVDGTGMPEDVVISANLETPNPSITDDHTIHVRNLPADFVIAAKWDGHWYALPANCTSSQSPTEGLLIEVDNIDNPQMAIAAPASAKFGLKSVYTSNSTNDRYEKNGANLVFVENVTEETPIANQTLYNGSETGIQVYAQYANYHTGNALRYEWTPTTTNLLDYTLTSAHTFTKTDGTPEEARTISLGNNGVFGTLLNDKSYNGEVRLLPATFYEPAQMQVLKWKANSVIVMYTGAETTATTQVGDNAKSDEQILAAQKLTHGIYELTTDQALTTNAGGELNIYIGTKTRVELEIPLIISGEVTASANAHDVVILENSKLTAAETKYSYKDVYVYGGAKLAIPDGTKLGVNNIILRAGGVATNGAGQEATYQYIYPQVELKGTLTSSVQNIRYEYVTDYDHWYHLVLPFDGSLASIHYPYEYYGDQVELDNKGSWIIKRYAGEIRATGNYDAWKDIETEGATSTTAGQGYIFWGAPKKITANDKYDRPTWGIQRITMSVSAPAAKTAENEDKTLTGLSSHKDVPNKSGAVNDQGWNLIGNPYMVNIATMSDAGLKAGKLEEEMVDDKWTGKWFNNGDNLRYLTIPSEHFDTYEAKTVSEAISANALVPGRAFFVQLDGEANGITFAADNRASLMPALRTANNNSVDIETGIVLSNETLQDEVNFWIKDGKTNDYEYNADYPKTPNNNHFNIYGVHTNGDLSWVAISPEIAAESMPIGYQVPAAGTYMLSVSEEYYSDDVDALLVTDHEMSPEVTTDLMITSYEFSVNQAETNNKRFTVAIKLKNGDNNDATGLDNLGIGNEHLMKFIYQDKIYILHHGVIYDATGKRVITINK